MIELHISRAFQQHQAYQIPTPYDEFLFKMSCKFNFDDFFGELLHATMWLKLPLNIFYFIHRILNF
jgi:hypothetical protein